MWTYRRLSSGVWCVYHYASGDTSSPDLTVAGFTSEFEANDWVIRFLGENARVTHEHAREEATAAAARAAVRDAELLKAFAEVKPVGRPS